MDDRIQKALIDRHIMKELLQELEPFVYRTSFHLTGHREDAEDVSQEVLYKICTKLHTFKGDSSLRTWVYSLVVNTCKDFARKKARNRTETLSDNLSHRSSEKELYLGLFLQDLIKSLSDIEKQIFVLRFQNELSVQEVAGILKMTESNVKTRVFRIREKLRGLFLSGGEQT